mmetsp:Transcript_38032/g.92543  ORF Transcript_38032/g.92543 Transcript_38032/m.92543 type:complete len:108 (+) Transcript_38032:196-519(+)|eukprot:CAMPEP_0113517498 /NCGR_PEP_ID=MMETSP0014_2-20120614/42301_1 /TAXON_ID=2857 /ORGANISM="Nitzschia sp." /LENGTH=107 /DNA_ID=CAMNT_0000414719 /DNA_START=138 /DNA_END=461 /DNA_ORIENTATION=- /assembly_acc=CAM_ASM_000159
MSSTDQSVMNQIPSSIMKQHDPNDDPFASLSDDSNQLQSPLEFGSGISYFVHDDNEKKKEDEDKQKGESNPSLKESDEKGASAANTTDKVEEKVEDDHSHEEKKDDA